MRIEKKWSLWLLGALIFLGSCHKEPENVWTRGDLLTETTLASYDTSFVRQLITGVGEPIDVNLQYAVTATKIIYITENAKGEKVKVSGVMMVPLGEGPFPLLSIQHGTIAKRTDVSSNNPLLNEGMVGIMAASEGYVSLIPDYPGLGESQGLHPYLVADVLARSVVDMLKAGQTYLEHNNIAETGELFLAGYSEGGYVTMATHRYLQLDEPGAGFTVTASAPMEGPYNLKLTVDTLLSYGVYKSPAFIAYCLTAYNEVYGWNRLPDIFNGSYADMMPSLFDGSHTTSEINRQLPDSLTLLLRPEFIQDYRSGKDQDLLNALNRNTLLGWGPKAPVRLFHGDADHTVPYWNAVTAREDMLQHGATHVDLVTIPGGTHATSVIPAFTGMMHWFDSLRVH